MFSSRQQRRTVDMKIEQWVHVRGAHWKRRAYAVSFRRGTFGIVVPSLWARHAVRLRCLPLEGKVRSFGAVVAGVFARLTR